MFKEGRVFTIVTDTWLGERWESLKKWVLGWFKKPKRFPQAITFKDLTPREQAYFTLTHDEEEGVVKVPILYEEVSERFGEMEFELPVYRDVYEYMMDGKVVRTEPTGPLE